MKTALIAFGDFDIASARELFGAYGVEITTVELLSKSDDLGFKRGYETFRDTADALIIADGADFGAKEKLAEITNSALLENDNARKALESRGETDFSGALMPPDATFIPNEKGAYQGYMTDERDFTLFLLPDKKAEFFPVCEKFVLPCLSAKSGASKSYIFKCFGEKEEAEKLLSGLSEKHGFKFSVLEKNGDLTVSVFFGENSDYAYRVAIREIALSLKDICYADFNTSLSETLFTLLKLSGKKIAVAESFTGGRVVSSIIKNAGASAYLAEGVVAYSNESKVKRLFVPEEDINKFGAVSAKVAYKMAAGLFKGANTDIVLATTGLAGPTGDGTGVPVGRCFIAAGTKYGIHTFKFDFSGDRETVTDKGVNAALFFAVKTIKNL